MSSSSLNWQLVHRLCFCIRTAAIHSASGYRFTCCSTTEGAVLHLPDGASRKDLRNRKPDFRQCAIQNAFRWYQFANRHLGRDIPNGSLILVTGCDMTSSWGIASFSDVSEDVEVELCFTPSYRDNETLYTWKTNVAATVRISPEHDSSSRENDSVQGRLQQQLAAGNVFQSIISEDIIAHHGTFNNVGQNQIYNITNNITLPSSKSCINLFCCNGYNTLFVDSTPEAGGDGASDRPMTVGTTEDMRGITRTAVCLVSHIYLLCALII